MHTQVVVVVEMSRPVSVGCPAPSRAGGVGALMVTVRVSVVGIANVETAVPVGTFPVPYSPVRYLPGWISTRVGGAGFNVARALAALDAQVTLTAPLAQDVAAAAVRAEAAALGLSLYGCATAPASTPRSVLLVDDHGRRQVHTDLADALGATTDEGALQVEGHPADVAVLANLDLSRPLLPVARRRGIPTVVDLQDVQGWDNPYDQDFLTAADLLLMSHERLTDAPREFLAGLMQRTRAGLLVLGMGAQGNLAWHRDTIEPVWTAATELPAGTETTGAGDTLLTGVVRYTVHERLPLPLAMQLATTFTAQSLTRRKRLSR